MIPEHRIWLQDTIHANIKGHDQQPENMSNCRTIQSTTRYIFKTTEAFIRSLIIRGFIVSQIQRIPEEKIKAPKTDANLSFYYKKNKKYIIKETMAIYVY